MDIPDGDRRRHDQPVPRTGGVAIFGTVLVIVAVACLAAPDLRSAFRDGSLSALALGGVAVFALGLIDDVSSLRASTKFLVEIGIAAGVWMAGVQIREIGFPGGGIIQVPAILSFAITILWIVGITNAFNLIDGSDGVAAGSALFAASAIALICFLGGNENGALVALVLAGATLGFLFFNFPPASVFLGDSGSLFLGYSLAALGVYTVQKAPTLLAIAIPVVSCGLPVLDTMLAMVRRFLRRESIFNSDRGHIHHRLRDLGHSPRTVALILYAASAGFALLTLLLAQSTGGMVAAGFMIAGAIMWVALQRLGIPELLELSRIFGRGLRQRSIIANNVRVREAITRVQAARDMAEVAQALTHAFAPGEFHSAEVSFLGSTRVLLNSPMWRMDASGFGWSWRAHDLVSTSELWEIRLPFHAFAEGPAGRLSLWGSAKDSHLLTDIRLIAIDLIPEVQRTIGRLEGATQPVAAKGEHRAVRQSERRPGVPIGISTARAENPSP